MEPVKEIPLEQTRQESFVIERADDKPESDTVTVAFASETPVRRSYGYEILDHSPGAMDMTRLSSGASVLVNHDQNQLVGVVQRAWIDTDKKARAEVRFGKSAFAQEIKRDVADGIRRLVSFRYSQDAYQLESEKDGVRTYRVTKYTPLELSFVSIPADPSVGVGRDHKPNLTQPKSNMPTQSETKVEVTFDADAERKKISDQIRADTDAIRAFANRMGIPELGEKFIREGKTFDDFRSQAIADFKSDKPLMVDDQRIGLSKKEKEQYSLVRALHTAAENGGKLPKGSGLEAEASEAAVKRSGLAPQGFMVPMDIMLTSLAEARQMGGSAIALAMEQCRAMTVNTPSTGGYLVGDTLLTGQFIDLLRNAALVRSLGPTVLSLTGPVRIPRQATAGTAAWKAEAAAITAVDASFGQLTLTPKRIGSGMSISKELIAQGSISVEAWARQEMATVIGIDEDLKFITGGGGVEPIGLLNTTGVGSLTYGAAPTWAKVVESETTTDTANALSGSIKWLSTPATRGKWKTTVKVAGQAIFLLEGTEANGYMFNASNQVPTNRTIFGNWSDAVIAEFGGLDITVDPYTNARSALVELTVNAWRDFGVRHPVAFTISTDSAAQ